MDTPSFENLRRFFERIKNVGFFERIFSWKAIVSLGYDAFGEYQRLFNLLGEKEQQLSDLTVQGRDLTQARDFYQRQVSRLQQDLSSEVARSQSLNDKITDKERQRATVSATLAETQANTELTILQLKGDLSASLGKFDQLNSQYIEAQKTLAEFRQKEQDRIREHDQRIADLNSLKKQLEDDRIRLQAEHDEEIRAEFADMEQTWRKHEEVVEQSLRSICQRHTIEYCDKENFPYADKKPDNALVICDQYVIFDAKSPKNPDELGNFPQYIRNQAEAAKKYAKEENVKKDIFLVVPANTLEYLDEFYLNMADYHVFIVTHECLEPVILALRKVEDYEFAEQLDPEDRENLCRVIGKFAHATKRRIQIDNYFSNEFIGLLQGCSSLPDEILKKVVEYEKAEKMNPPMEKRKKLIPIKELDHDVKVISKEAEAREIDITAVTKEKIEDIPLDKIIK